MIAIARVQLDEELTSRLDNRTAQLKTAKADSAQARVAWRSADTERRGVRTYLEKMAAGIQRCMYCGDNLDTEIDHFEPISSAPIRTFEWLNHLLACSFCNSNQKRHSYPRDPSGMAPRSPKSRMQVFFTLWFCRYIYPARPRSLGADVVAALEEPVLMSLVTFQSVR